MKSRIPRQASLMGPDIQNPFLHKLHLSPFHIVQIVLMSVTLAPLRLVLIGLLLILLWPLAFISTAFQSQEDRDKPITGWRKYFELPFIYIGRAIVFVIGFHNVKVKGEPKPSSEAPIICGAPHSSFFDTLAIFYCSGLPSAVSKKENSSVFILGSLMSYAQPVWVKREDHNSRTSTIKEIQRRVQTRGEWPQIILFPEGTCTNRSCLITFKLGAFHPGVPVQPMCLRYSNRLDTVTWTWDGPGAFCQFWLTLCQFHTNLEIEFLPVYVPNEEEKKDPKLFASNVRQKMSECLEIPVTDHTFDDCRLMLQAQKLKLPMQAGLVEFQKLHKKLGISLEQMQKLLETFGSINYKGDGLISLEEFSTYLQIPVNPALEDVFAMYDRDGSGTIDFREYVIGLSLISNPVNNEETIQLAFKGVIQGMIPYMIFLAVR
uniref:Lysophosphatidylcholine acyltransferase 1 n=1 Tax=Sinohyriopsis cumingii TaxID=165450 RepID=A0A8K1MNV6_SINCU|nr:lysophosphatidylcholine acyltransferase 1 [Sinohyriopsis cumingii]